MWTHFGVCKCGYFIETSHGNPWFWPDVCPGCGEDPGSNYYDGTWELVVGRRRGIFGRKLEIKKEES